MITAFKLGIWAVSTVAAVNYGGWFAGLVAFLITPFILRQLK